jgi:hypothetical protein
MTVRAALREFADAEAGSSLYPLDASIVSACKA